MRCFVAIVLALLAAREARADVATAAVFVRGLPSGVDAVLLESARKTFRAEARVESGEALLAAVPPGRYEIAWGGSPPLTVVVGPGEVVTVDAAAARVVGRGTLTWGTWFDAEALRSLPSSGDAWSLLETAEPVAVVDRLDTGGLFTGEPARVNAHGGSWTETSFVVDGADVTDPRRGGRPLVLPDIAGAAGFGFVSAAAPVDVAGSGPVIAVLAPEAPARWSLSAVGATALGSSDTRPTPRSVSRLESWNDADVRLAGPLSPRGTLVLSGGWRRSRRAAEFSLPSARLARASMDATWRPGASQELHLSGLAQDIVRPSYQPVLNFTAEDRRVSLAASWRLRSASGASVGAQAAFSSTRVRDDIGTGVLDRLVDGPVAEYVAEGGGTARRASGDVWFRAAPRRWMGWHALSAGASLSANSVRSDGFDGTVGERVGTQPARLWRFASGSSRWSSREAALFVADRVVAGGLALEAGVRLDGVWARARGGGEIDGLVLSPRVSATWAVFGSDLVVARGAWGRFAHRLPLEWLGHGDPEAPQAEVYRWLNIGLFPPVVSSLVARRGPGAPIGSIDPDLRRPYSDELLLALESRVGPLHFTFAGIDRRGRDLVETVNVGLLPSTYLPSYVPDPAGDIIGPADDQLLPLYRRAAGPQTDHLLLTNPAGHATKFQAVEFTAALRRNGRAGILLGATAHRSEVNAGHRGFRSFENDPGVIGELFDEPNADTFPYGRSFFDRAYTIKLSGYWRAPGDIRLGAVARYQDGQPFARLVIDAAAPQGPDIVRAVPNGRHRYEYTLTVDARAEKGFTLGRARLGLVVEAFNLLDNRHVVEEDVTSGPAFRTPTLVQPPRVLRVGLRLDL